MMASFNLNAARSDYSNSTQPDEDKALEEDQELPPSPRKELARQQEERRAADAAANAAKKQEAVLNIGFERIQEFFGKDPRSGQRAVLKALCEPKDVVLRARTGFGKSLIFYGFLLMQPVDSKRDISIIFTPLEGLGQQMMDDLNAYFGKRPEDDVLKTRAKTMKKGACFLDGSSTREDISKVGQGDFRWVFITPEKAKSVPVMDMFQDQAFRAKVNLITIDEAHLVDEWGSEFRPAYGEVGKIRSLFGKTVPWFVTSATLPLQQRDAVLESLKMPLDTLTINEELGRDNLYYNIQPLGIGIKYVDGTTPIDHLIDLCRDDPNNIPKTLVYFDSIRALQNVAKHLRSLFPEDFSSTLKEKLVQVYFSSRPKRGKHRTFEAFKKGECRIVLATEAFGMGMDVPDIIRVYNWGVPRSLASMIQRFGRGARDQSLVAICTLLLPTFASNIAIREGSVGAPTILSAGELRAWKKTELCLYNKLSAKNPAVMSFLESRCYRRAIAAYLDDSRPPGELLGSCCRRCSEREGAEVPQSIGPSENYIDSRSKGTPKHYSTTKYLAGIVQDQLIKWRLNLFKALSTLPNDAADADSIPGLLSLEAIMPLKTLQKLSSRAAYIAKGGISISDVVVWGTMAWYMECCFPAYNVEPLKDVLVSTFEAGEKLQKSRAKHLASSKNSGMSLKERQKEVDDIMAIEEAAAFGDIDGIGLEQLHGDAAADDNIYNQRDWEEDDDEALGLRHMT